MAYRHAARHRVACGFRGVVLSLFVAVGLFCFAFRRGAGVRGVHEPAGGLALLARTRHGVAAARHVVGARPHAAARGCIDAASARRGLALEATTQGGAGVNLLDRYIGINIAGSTLIVLLVLMALFSLGGLVAELDAVGKGGYTLVHAAEYVLRSMPRLAYQLFPVVALLGSVIGLGMMASNNELLVMRAAGVS